MGQLACDGMYRKMNLGILGQVEYCVTVLDAKQESETPILDAETTQDNLRWTYGSDWSQGASAYQRLGLGLAGTPYPAALVARYFYDGLGSLAEFLNPYEELSEAKLKSMLQDFGENENFYQRWCKSGQVEENELGNLAMYNPCGFSNAADLVSRLLSARQRIELAQEIYSHLLEKVEAAKADQSTTADAMILDFERAQLATKLLGYDHLKVKTLFDDFLAAKSMTTQRASL